MNGKQLGAVGPQNQFGHNQSLELLSPAGQDDIVSMLVKRRQQVFAWAKKLDPARRPIVKLKGSFGDLIFSGTRISGRLAHAVPRDSAPSLKFTAAELISALDRSELKSSFCLSLPQLTPKSLSLQIAPLGFQRASDLRYKLTVDFRPPNSGNTKRPICSGTRSDDYRAGFLFTPADDDAPARFELYKLRMENVSVHKLSVISPGSLEYRLRQTYQQVDLATPDGEVHPAARQDVIPAIVDYLRENLTAIESALTDARRDPAATLPVTPPPAALKYKCTLIRIYTKRVARFERGDTNVPLSYWTNVFEKDHRTGCDSFETRPTVSTVTVHHAKYHELAAKGDFVATMASLVGALNSSK
ncbi:hypothetical protein H9P43_006844 [Blastocladiella emersonii ATCC 22665]|nr:hypothetical protein H9P43_006844 [Blastocladiella emersonii ATCC 22665]